MTKQEMIDSLTTKVKELEELVAHKESNVNELYAKLRNISAVADDHQRQVKKWEAWNKEMFERHRSQLMSIYYMLDAVSKTGTHRQKEAVIIFHKEVLKDLIHNGDNLPLNPREELPF